MKKRLTSKRVRGGLALFAFLFCASLAEAQLTRGTITGTVTDQSGAAVPGAAITITNVDTGVARTSETGATGRYEAPGLPAGNYEVSAMLAGFQTSIRSGIALTVGRNAVVNIILQVGEVAQAVTVTGEVTFVETTSATVSQLVDEQKVEDLPLPGRDLTELTFLQPGVLRVPQGGGQSAFSGMGQKISVAGARATQNIYLLDGVNNGDLSGNAQGASGAYIGAETVKEFQIVTNNYSAEYRSQAGAIVSAVTKSGTNALHGSLFETIRNDNVDAAQWEDNARCVETDFLKCKPEFKRNQFGGSLGGPVISDRTFFFGSYEGLRERLGTTQTERVPDANAHKGLVPITDDDGNVIGTKDVGIDPDIAPYLALFPIPDAKFPSVPGSEGGEGTVDIAGVRNQPTTDDFVALKMDHTLTDNNLLSGTYNFNESGRSPFGILGDLEAGGITSLKHTLSTGLTNILSPGMLNEFKFGYSFSEVGDDVVLSTRDFSGLQFHPTRERMGQINAGEAGSIGYRVDGSTYTAKTITLKDGVSLTRGNHSFRLGVEINRFKYQQSSCSRGCNGIYDFRSVERFLRNQPRRLQIFIPGKDSPERNLAQLLFGAYFQDNWQLSPSFTLNLGMRYEFATVPSEDDEQISNLVNFSDSNVSVPTSIAARFPEETFAGTIDSYYTNATLKSFSPRFGFAWAPGDRKFSVRGGFGIFYEHPMLFNIRTSLQELPPYTVSGRLDDDDAEDAGLPLRLFNKNSAGQFPVELYQELLDARPNIRYMEYEEETTYMYRWSLTLQREIADWVLSAGYTGSRSLHLWIQDTSNVRKWDGWPENPAPGERKHWTDGAKRINDNFGAIRTQRPNGINHYQGLALSAQKRFSRGLQAQLSYNFAKTIGMAPGVTSGGENYPQSFRGIYYWDTHLKKGLSAHDIRNSFVSNFTYQFPRGDFGGIGNAIVNGWQINGIITLLNGHPLTINESSDDQDDIIGHDDRLRPNLIPGGNNNPTTGVAGACAGDNAGRTLGGPDIYYDPCQFVNSELGYFGNLGPRTMSSPGLATFDFSILKDFNVTENSRIQFRAEFFNLFNRPNFGTPDTGPFSGSGKRDANAGRIGSTRTTARQIQFGLKFTF